MEYNKKHIKINSGSKQILVREQSSTILSLFSSELKYMFPWSQYDEVSLVNKKYRTRKTEYKLGTHKNKLKNIHISNTMETIK